MSNKYIYLILIVFLSTEQSYFGITTSKTPSEEFASIFSVSILSGSVKLRVNLPKEVSNL